MAVSLLLQAAHSRCKSAALPACAVGKCVQALARLRPSCNIISFCSVQMVLGHLVPCIITLLLELRSRRAFLRRRYQQRLVRSGQATEPQLW